MGDRLTEITDLGQAVWIDDLTRERITETAEGRLPPATSRPRR
jgi:hypothetical protein